MPRTAREKASLGIYHVMMRGINHQQIFEEDDDHLTFLGILHKLKNRIIPPTDKTVKIYDIYAYALMGNHFHLLVRPRTVEIGELVKMIASSYVFYYNGKHGRDGHLFKERFKSEPCEDREYFITLLRYIHQNPVKAGIVKKVKDFKYTSWHEYMNPSRCQHFVCDITPVLKIISLKELAELVEAPLEDNVRCLDYEFDGKRRRLDDKQVRRLLNKQYGFESPTELQKLKAKDRNNVLRALLEDGAGVRQLQRLTGIGKNIISRCGTGDR